MFPPLKVFYKKQFGFPFSFHPIFILRKANGNREDTEQHSNDLTSFVYILEQKTRHKYIVQIKNNLCQT